MAGDLHDLLLVHADQGPQHRHGGHVLANGQRLHGLAGHLTQIFSGDQGAASQLQRQHIGQAHHEPPHDQGKVILRALAAYLLLNFGKGDDEHRQPAAPGGQLLRQLQHLLPGQFAGIGRRGEVDHLQLYAPLGDHIAGHRAVDTAGQQAHRVAAHTQGQTARGALGGAVDVGRVLPYLDVHRQLRVVYVHRQVGEGVVERAAHPLAQLDAAMGKDLSARLLSTLKLLAAVSAPPR